MSRRKEYLNKLKKTYRARHDSDERDYLLDHTDERGRATVSVRLNDSDDIFHPLSPDRGELHPDIYEFMEAQVEPIPVVMPLCIRFTGDISDGSTQEALKKAYQTHMSMRLRRIRHDLRINRLKTFVLLAIGLILLGAYFIMEFLHANVMFVEFLSIAGTFSVWEAVDLFLLEHTALKVEYHKALQLACADLEFITTKED